MLLALQHISDGDRHGVEHLRRDAGRRDRQERGSSLPSLAMVGSSMIVLYVIGYLNTFTDTCLKPLRKKVYSVAFEHRKTGDRI